MIFDLPAAPHYFGPEHEVTLEVGGKGVATGKGKSIKEAEQAAAGKALKGYGAL